MTQTKEELDEFYQKPDPWEFQVNPDDAIRKNKIIDTCRTYGPFKKALDVGCGEGWITKDLPAKKLFGYEASDTAKSRWPKKPKIIDINVVEPFKNCDLVIATGILYPQYDHAMLIDMILFHAEKIIVTCNIKDWEVDLNKIEKFSKQIHIEEFAYREYTQVLRVFEVL